MTHYEDVRSSVIADTDNGHDGLGATGDGTHGLSFKGYAPRHSLLHLQELLPQIHRDGVALTSSTKSFSDNWGPDSLINVVSTYTAQNLVGKVLNYIAISSCSNTSHIIFFMLRCPHCNNIIYSRFTSDA